MTSDPEARGTTSDGVPFIKIVLSDGDIRTLARISTDTGRSCSALLHRWIIEHAIDGQSTKTTD